MKDDDITVRAAEFERRLAKAGSTEDIISGLVKGLERNQRIVKYLTISLILDVILSIALGVIAAISWVQNNNIEANTTRIESIGHQTCTRVNANSSAINDFLDLIIMSYKSGAAKGVPPDVVQTQIAKYENMKVEVLSC